MDLLGDVEVRTVRGDADVDVRDVVVDSRRAAPGALFCCVPGARTDGHEHAADAVARGAVALLVERPLDAGVVEVEVADARRAMAPLAAAVHGHPSRTLAVVGVTGTNGKTTVTHLVAEILERVGRPAGVIGTLSGERTTPEAPDLQRRLASMLADGKVAAAVEVSSHALDLHRVDAMRFAVAAFTNLGRDHLDHHGTVEAYFRAKARLFRPDLAAQAVVNRDDPHGRLLLDAAEVPTIGYGLDDAADLRCDLDGSRFTWRGVDVVLPLLGRFNVSNALAALECAVALGVAPAEAAAALGGARPVPGRVERVDDGAGPAVLVDYAHTPDALAAVLATARELAEGRVLVAFGCGGDRDRGKRPAMGRAAVEGADVVVLTSDNPRSEDPQAIVDEVLAGVPDDGVLVELDRRAAIRLVVGAAAPGDVVVIAGKGHEAHQIAGGERSPFDDRDEARAALRAAGGGAR